mmetsp:Transcript_44578/g.80135  ORF Transcript_44578/g.80135 Transcript_44578/m.80135 type:complete len:210 (+) Transcript_44578:68-697(+)
MLPFSGGPQLNGPLTPEMQEKLRKIRFCVIGVFVAGVGRFCTGDMPFNELLCGITGIFLLDDDPNVAPCYACLISSPIGQCTGNGGTGLSCLMAFMLISGMNSFFLTMRFLIGGPFVLLSFVCQLAGAILAYRLNALVSAAAAAAGDLGGQGLPLTQPLAGMRGPGPGFPPGPGGPPGGGAPGPRPPSAPSTGPPGFQAFQGSGMRLGG